MYISTISVKIFQLNQLHEISNHAIVSLFEKKIGYRAIKKIFEDDIYINEQNVRLKILSITYRLREISSFNISAYESAKRFNGILHTIANKCIDVRM